MSWLKKISQTELIDISYLIKQKMRPNFVFGEIVIFADENSHIRPGTVGVLIHDPNAFVVAMNIGMMGFAPFDTYPQSWIRTGEEFSGSPQDLEQKSKSINPTTDLTSVPIIQSLISLRSDVTHYTMKPDYVRVIFFEKPLGPGGYRSDYQLIIKNSQNDVFSVIVVIKGETTTMRADKDNLASVIRGAVSYLQQEKRQ